MSKQHKRDVSDQVIAVVEKMYQLIYTQDTKKVLNDVKDKDIVMFVGNTRCGKSTVVNYVIGQKLIAIKKGAKVFHIIREDPKAPGPAIGSNATSETTIPSAWSSTKIKGVVVDAPGFDDNRGVSQDVANAFYVKEILNSVRSIKLVLISDIVDVTSDNIGQFTSFIDKILTMLPHSGQLHKGIVMLFNKDKEGYTKEEISEILKEKILDQTNMQVKNRQLAEYFHKNNDRIVTARTPKSVGPINEEYIFNNLISTIETKAVNVQRSEMSSIIPGLSDRSRAFLLEAHNHLSEANYFDEALRSTLNEFTKGLTKYNVGNLNSESRTKVLPLKRELEELERQIKAIRNSASTLADKLKQLGVLVPTVQQLKENSDLYLKLKFSAFIDDVIKIKESTIFTVKIFSLLSHMLDTTSQMKTSLQEWLMEITQEEANKRMADITKQHQEATDRMSRQIDNLKEENRKSMENQRKSLGFFGTIGSWFDSVFGL